MSAYEKGSPAYFATPPVNLIYAFHASLSTITRGAVSLEERFAAHKKASARVKEAAAELGLLAGGAGGGAAAERESTTRVVTSSRAHR